MNGTQMEIARGLLENNRALMQGHLLVLRDGFSQKLLSPVWGLQWPFMRGTLARPLPDSYWSYLFNFVFMLINGGVPVGLYLQSPDLVIRQVRSCGNPRGWHWSKKNLLEKNLEP